MNRREFLFGAAAVAIAANSRWSVEDHEMFFSYQWYDAKGNPILGAVGRTMSYEGYEDGLSVRITATNRGNDYVW